jgi:phosphopantetheinyl transferase
MIRVAIGGLYHFGIYVSDDEVIQFGLPPTRHGDTPQSEIEVLSSDVDAFLDGGFLEVCEFDKKEKKKNRTPEQIVEYARAKIGTRGYHILYNNCEHFANECVSGVQICRQAEDVRALFRKMPIVDVYIAQLPQNEPIGKVECKERRAEIEAVSNENVRREKYFVWQLLCYALERSFGPRVRKMKFAKQKWGGWSVGDLSLSLSHGEGALAVAVSRAPVGMDIQGANSLRDEKIASRILTAAELSEYEKTPPERKKERLIQIWTAKEAIFKSKGLEAFIPNQTDTLTNTVRTDSVIINGEKYYWSVATATPEIVRVFADVDLTKIK